jgi:hypothetical protein
LFDVIDGENKDARFDEQIFAVLIAAQILTDAERGEQVVERVEEELLTAWTAIAFRRKMRITARFYPLAGLSATGLSQGTV